MPLDRLKDFRLHGIAKILHSFIMILTYPFRHIFKFLAFTFVAAVLLAAIPMTQGVRYTDIPEWYLLKYKNSPADILSAPTETPPFSKAIAAEEKLPEVKAPAIIRHHAANPAENTAGRRQAFKPADSIARPEKKYKSLNIRAENNENSVRDMQSASVISEPEQKDMQTEKAYYRKTDELPLVYEEVPQEVKGKTFIFSDTELTVGDSYLILYGIAVSKQNRAQAHQYLKDLADGKDLTCRIVAYTHHNIATGVCFLNGQSINQMLVNAGWAENIAL